MDPKSTLHNAFSVGSPDTLQGVPDWVHLLPKGRTKTVDDRAFIDFRGNMIPMVSSHGHKQVTRIYVDVNHANMKRGSGGEASPAQGWITELAVRDDGLWGRVEWNESGRKLLEDKSYIYMSAEVFSDSKTGEVIAIAGASLTNRPALHNLTPLFLAADDTDTNNPNGDPMDKIMVDLCATLKLKDGADATAILAAVTALAASDAEKALQIAALGKTLGAADGATYEQITLTATELKDPAKTVPASALKELQAQMQALTAQNTALVSDRAREKAESFVAQKLAEGRIGLTDTMRKHYIERHMFSADSAKAVELELNNLPLMKGGSIIPATQPKDGVITLSAEDSAAAKALGVSEDDFKKIRAAEAANKEFA